MKDLIDQFDDERRKLARQLHSTAAQQLAALQIQLSLIGNAKLDERAAKSLREASELAQACAREMRTVCSKLHPPLLDEVGLAAALRVFASETGVQLSAEFPEEVGPLPPRLALGAFRIVEELLRNVENRKEATIGLIRMNDALTITVSGAGEPPQSCIAARIEALGGQKTLWIFGAPWRLTVTLPLTSAES